MCTIRTSMLLAALAATPCFAQETVSTAPSTDGPWPAAFQVTSRIEPVAVVPLLAPHDGHVAVVHVSPGHPVAQGTVILELRVPHLRTDLAAAQARMRQAEIAVKIAEGDVARANLGVEEHQEDLVMIRNGAEQRKQTLLAAIANEDRIRRLFEASRVTEAAMMQATLEATEARAEAKTLSAEVKRATSIVDASRIEVTQCELRVASAKAGVDEAAAEVERASLALEATHIQAPIDSVVRTLGVAAGASVRAFETQLTTLIDLSQVRFRAQIPRSEIRRVDVGTKVWIRRGRDSAETEESVVASVGLEVQRRLSDALSRPMTVAFHNRDGRWLVGDECVCWVFPDSGPPAQMIPARAVIEEDGTHYAYFVQAKRGTNRVSRKKLALGRTDGDRVEVLSGLRSYPVVLDPTSTLEDGATVVIK